MDKKNLETKNNNFDGTHLKSFNINSVLSNLLKQSRGDKNFDTTIQNKNYQNEISNHMSSNVTNQFTNFPKSANENYKKEISILKSYINRLNNELKKYLKNDFYCVELTCSENKIDDMETFIKFFNDSVERLLNPDYLNPLFSIYDNHILNLEAEIKNLKNSCKKYESIISDLIKENSEIREELLLKNNELQEAFKFKINEGSSQIYDIEYLNSLEERLLLLSRENEILALNYQKISKELFQFSCEYTEKHKESLDKISMFSDMEKGIRTLSTNLESEILKNGLNEGKIMDLSEKISKVEQERDFLRLEMEKISSENKTLSEANCFYKNYIQKLSRYG